MGRPTKDRSTMARTCVKRIEKTGPRTSQRSCWVGVQGHLKSFYPSAQPRACWFGMVLNLLNKDRWYVLSWSESLATYQYNKITTGFWTYPIWTWLEKHVFLHNMERHGEVFTLHWEIGKLGKWGERHVVIAMSVLTAGHLEMTWNDLTGLGEKSWYDVTVQSLVEPNSPTWMWWNNMEFFCKIILRNHQWLCPISDGTHPISAGSHYPLAIWSPHPCSAFPWPTYWSTLCVWTLGLGWFSWVPRCRKCWSLCLMIFWILYIFCIFCLADHLGIYIYIYKDWLNKNEINNINT